MVGQSRCAIPYSMVTALDLSDAFPLVDLAGQRIARAEEGQIVLTQWAAEDLQAQVGDKLRIEYFAPETTHGQALRVERGVDSARGNAANRTRCSPFAATARRSTSLHLPWPTTPI